MALLRIADALEALVALAQPVEIDEILEALGYEKKTKDGDDK